MASPPRFRSQGLSSDSTPSVEICLTYSDGPNQAFLGGNEREGVRKKGKVQVPDVTDMKQTKNVKPPFRESQHFFLRSCVFTGLCLREDSPIVLETQFRFGSSMSEGSAHPFFQGSPASRSDPRARAEAAD